MSVFCIFREMQVNSEQTFDGHFLKPMLQIVGNSPYFTAVKNGILHGLIIGGFYYETNK